MYPFHATALDGFGKPTQIQEVDFMGLDERDDNLGAPLADGVEVDV